VAGGRLFPVFPVSSQEIVTMEQQEKKDRFQIERLEERIAPSNGNFPPGQFPSGNPAQAPGQSNPNEVPATNPSNG
jgi:hypothetical protein